ncbi:hypothetical protein [Halorubellus litoreus]|uniref:Uncharacterized protein n=1 Tax=Halorubellus litoreus TaxID=755308 RepID=A0ABD5V8C5_9EURY
MDSSTQDRTRTRQSRARTPPSVHVERVGSTSTVEHGRADGERRRDVVVVPRVPSNVEGEVDA